MSEFEAWASACGMAAATLSSRSLGKLFYLLQLGFSVCCRVAMIDKLKAVSLNRSVLQNTLISVMWSPERIALIACNQTPVTIELNFYFLYYNVWQTSWKGESFRNLAILFHLHNNIVELLPRWCLCLSRAPEVCIRAITKLLPLDSFAIH